MYQDTLILYVKCKSGVNLKETNSNIVNIYPNPVDKLFKLSGLPPAKYSHIEIYTISGNLVRQQKIYNEDNIDVSNLVKGIYIVKLSVNDKGIQHSFRLIKE